MRTGSYDFEIVGDKIEIQNQLDVICAEHGVETAWSGEKQFLHDGKWIEISGWTQEKLYMQLGY